MNSTTKPPSILPAPMLHSENFVATFKNHADMLEGMRSVDILDDPHIPIAVLRLAITIFDKKKKLFIRYSGMPVHKANWVLLAAGLVTRKEILAQYAEEQLELDLS